MKLYLFSLTLIALICSCGAPSLLITEANEIQTVATIDSIQYINTTNSVLSINAYTPYSSADFNRKNITNSWSIDSRLQTVKFGELMVKLGTKARLANLPSTESPKDGLKNIFHYQINYNYPVFKWKQEKTTPIHISIKVDHFHFKTIFATSVEKSLNVRIGVNNDPFYQTTSQDYYPRFLENKYPYSSSDYFYSKHYDNDNSRKAILLEQSSTILRLGISLKKVQNISIIGNHPKLGAFWGKKNKYNQFYADFMLLVANSGISPVIYDYKLITYSGSNTITGSIDANENVDFETLVQKQIWGACLGYYQEFYFKSSPVIMSLKTELGIRPGNYHDNKWNENYYLQIGLGIGGWCQLKNKQ